MGGGIDQQMIAGEKIRSQNRFCYGGEDERNVNKSPTVKTNRPFNLPPTVYAFTVRTGEGGAARGARRSGMGQH